MHHPIAGVVEPWLEAMGLTESKPAQVNHHKRAWSLRHGKRRGIAEALVGFGSTMGVVANHTPTAKDDADSHTDIRDRVNASLVKDYFLLDPMSYPESSLTATDIAEMNVLDYTNRLRLSEPSGARGGYSDVARGTDIRTNHMVAVKMLRSTGTTKGDDQETRMRKRLGRELLCWIRLQHPHVLPLLGFAFIKENGDRPCLITAWCSNGNLSEYLGKTPDANRRSLTYQVAEGVAYLHSRTPPVVHADLKPLNILISDGGDALICDFGLSKELGMSSGMTTALTGAGTARYCAPENFSDVKPSTQADVYAFGCVALEILTKQMPFANETNDFMVIRAVLENILPGIRHERPELSENDPLWDVIEGCWAKDPVDRPTMTVVAKTLKLLVH